MGFDGVDIITADAGDKLHRKQFASGVLPVDFRDFNLRQAGVFHVAGEAFRVCSVPGEVQLFSNLDAEVFDERDRIVHAQFRLSLFDEFGNGPKKPYVLLDFLGNLRALDFECEHRPVQSYRTVHLGDGGRGQRLWVDGCEEVTPVGNVVVQCRDYFVEGNDSDSVLQAGEFGNHLRREKLGSGAHELSELDKGRSQVFERHAEPCVGRVFAVVVCLAFLRGSGNSRSREEFI